MTTLHRVNEMYNRTYDRLRSAMEAASQLDESDEPERTRLINQAEDQMEDLEKMCKRYNLEVE